MRLQRLKTCLVILFCSFIVGCSTTKPPLRPDIQSNLNQAQRLFAEGYYKESKQLLYPLACEGVPQAQYALGYLYYNGYGVQQDTDVGVYWIKRAADQQYVPAIKALEMIHSSLRK